MTLATRYNAEAKRLMPHIADELAVDATIDNANHIEEIIFSRSEFLGGMAVVLLTLIERQK